MLDAQIAAIDVVERQSTSLLAQVRGLEIHAESGEGGIVNLIVRADEKHCGMLGRLRQYLANAFFRAGDLCYPGNHNRSVRVVRVDMNTDPVDDGLPDCANSNLVEVIPLNLANGDAYYNALLIHESVKGHKQGHRFTGWRWQWWKKRADDPCGQSVSPVMWSKPGTVTVHPDTDQ